MNAGWRELYRCDDLLQARAVATSVAAMEFEVRLTGLDSDHDQPDEADSDFPGPYLIEVPDQHWPVLADVLDEIIDEQREFDEALQIRTQRRRTQTMLVMGAAGAAELAIIWRLLEA
jgi:hypothetical protein